MSNSVHNAATNEYGLNIDRTHDALQQLERLATQLRGYK
jgi:hypothetical protein